MFGMHAATRVFATQVVAALETSDRDQPAARLQSSSTTTVASPDENTQDSRARKCRKRELAHRDTSKQNQVHTSKEENRSPLTRAVNNKKLLQSIRERLGHARDQARPLHLVLDALHRAGPMNLLDQIAPREGHEAVHEGILRR